MESNFPGQVRYNQGTGYIPEDNRTEERQGEYTRWFYEYLPNSTLETADFVDLRTELEQYRESKTERDILVQAFQEMRPGMTLAMNY